MKEGKRIKQMRVYVNNISCDLLPGMTARHALIQSGLLKKGVQSQKVFDEQGNEIGLDGALSDGDKIYLR
jgi:hypothetical protein